MKNGNLLKILIPAVVILGALVLYQNVYVKSANRLADLRDRRAAAAEALKRYQKLVDEKPLFEKKLESMRGTRNDLEAGLFSGQSLSITSAALQDTVKTIIASGGGIVSSEKADKAEPLGKKFMIVSASFDMTLPDTNALTNVLYQIETHKPVMVIKELSIQCMNIRDPKALSARLTVAALTGGPVNETGGNSIGRPVMGQPAPVGGNLINRPAAIGPGPFGRQVK